MLFLLFLAACAAAGATGLMFPTGTWYTTLAKPSWTPPNWVFPVAWTTIYILVAFAGARAATHMGNSYAMAFWALQIALNTLWTPLFFGLRHVRAALIVIGILWLAVFCATIAHFQLDVWAGLAFLPYLAWLSVATALNYQIFQLNPGVVPLRLSEL